MLHATHTLHATYTLQQFCVAGNTKVLQGCHAGRQRLVARVNHRAFPCTVTGREGVTPLVRGAD